MHVLVAAHDFYPDPGSGGCGRYVYETARRLVARGHEVSVVTRRRGDVPTRERVDGVGVYRYDLETADRSARSIYPQLVRADRTVASHVAALAGASRPDVLSVQGPVTSPLVGRHLDGVPLVPTFHSPWPTEYLIRTRHERSAPRRWVNAAVRWVVEWRTLARADRALTLSAFMRDELARVYRLDPDVAVVPGGVDPRRFSPSAGPGDRVPAGDPAFLTVRRLSERMGHDLLLEAFASVVERRPDAHLYVAGDGPLRDRLERSAADHGVADHTTFLGYVPDADLPGVYASADVFILPTRELEGFGLATLEALASGTPVVGTAVGGTVELLTDLEHDPTIPAPTLVSPNDADALARALLAWTDVPDGALSTAGRTCRTYASERYSWQRTVDRLEACYADVVYG